MSKDLKYTSWSFVFFAKLILTKWWRLLRVICQLDVKHSWPRMLPRVVITDIFWWKSAPRRPFRPSVRPPAFAFTPRKQIYPRTSFYCPRTHHCIHGKNRVRTDARVRPHGHKIAKAHPRGRPPASTR